MLNVLLKVLKQYLSNNKRPFTETHVNMLHPSSFIKVDPRLGYYFSFKHVIYDSYIT